MITKRLHRQGRSVGVAPEQPQSQLRMVQCVPPLLVAITGLLSTAELTAATAPATTMPAILSTAIMVAAFSALLAVAAWATVAWARSRWWHVFSARRVCTCGIALFAIAGLLVASLLRRDPFVHLTTELRIATSDIAAVGIVAAIVICLVMAVTALVEAWDARLEERYWANSLPTG